MRIVVGGASEQMARSDRVNCASKEVLASERQRRSRNKQDTLVSDASISAWLKKGTRC
jgi:hypothetical protein